jgi:tRNA(Arg) A34 adenosine deaminase TadA
LDSRSLKKARSRGLRPPCEWGGWEGWGGVVSAEPRALANVQGAESAVGQSPFGAVIVREGANVAATHNTVWRDTDPTAHAEVNCIRSAAKELEVIDLSGCEMYSTCEPCPMCLAAIHWAKIDRRLRGKHRRYRGSGLLRVTRRRPRPRRDGPQPAPGRERRTPRGVRGTVRTLARGRPVRDVLTESKRKSRRDGSRS